MKKIVPFLALVVISATAPQVWPAAALAQSSGDCAQIGNANLRHDCRAQRSGNLGECAQITNADDRHFCRARETSNLGECAQIGNADLRHSCRARLR